MRTLQRRAGRRARAVLGLTAVLASVSVIAATPATASALDDHHRGNSRTIDVTGVDFSYVIKTHGPIGAGLIDFRFHNRGGNDHQAQLLRLDDGVTPAKFKADLLANGPAAAFADTVPTGGAAILRPWDNQRVWDFLQGGTYAIVCFVPTASGVPHYAMGMISFFQVHGMADPMVHPRFHVEGVIKAHDLTYTIPKVLERDEIYKFVDTESDEVHELNLGRLKPGKTVADAKAYFQRLIQPGNPGPAPFWSEGGHGAVLPHGGHGWFMVDDDRGRYIAYCLVPNNQGIPHAALGMVVGVRVR